MGKHRHEKVAKMRHMPGTIPRRDQIAMMEKDTPIEVHPWQTIGEKAAKSFRKDQRKRAKTVVKRRLDREMRLHMEEKE